MLFRIFKMIASSGFLTALECTKFSAGALPRTPLGPGMRSPRLPGWFKGDLLLRGRGEKGEEDGGEGKGRREEGKGRKGEGEGRGGYGSPNANSWIRPWSVMHFIDIFQ